MKESKIISNFYPKHPKLDDCYWDNETESLVTTDSMAEKTHFLQEWSSPKEIASKLIEVNVSDILASGGFPTKAFLNLGLSNLSGKDNWIREFQREFLRILGKYKISLCGGDTYFSELTNLNLTVWGKLLGNRPIFRSGGKQRSLLYISGAVGYSFLGYKILREMTDKKKFLISHLREWSRNKKIPFSVAQKAIAIHLSPKSEWEKRKFLKKNISNLQAMMDITDGIVQDSEKLAIASEINVTVRVEALPEFSLLNQYLTISEIVSSGEELKLLFISNKPIPKSLGIPIGYTRKGDGKTEFTYNQKPIIVESGFEHFG